MTSLQARLSNVVTDKRQEGINNMSVRECVCLLVCVCVFLYTHMRDKVPNLRNVNMMPIFLTFPIQHLQLLKLNVNLNLNFVKKYY